MIVVQIIVIKTFFPYLVGKVSDEKTGKVSTMVNVLQIFWWMSI